jgi:hypothetical protein
VPPSRVLAASLAVVLVPLIGGCGVGAGGDRDDIQGVVSRYLSASAQGNGRQACAYLVPALRRQMALMAHRKHLRGCPELLGTRIRYRVAALPGNLRTDVGDAFADRDRIHVDMPDDDHATASLEMPHYALDDARFALVRTADGWRIEKLS